MKSVSVIGGGFSGLAVSNYLINKFPQCCINLYDLEKLPGNRGASAISGGLMHPFTPKGKLIWKGLEGFKHSYALMQSCQPYSEAAVVRMSPILRPFSSPDDANCWMTCCSKYPELLELVRPEDYVSIVYHTIGINTTSSSSIVSSSSSSSSSRSTNRRGGLGGVLFKRSAVVSSAPYLQALWRRLMALSPSSRWIQQSINPSDILRLCAENDAVVIAAGPGVQELWNEALPFKYVRGQNLVYALKSNSSISSHCHLTEHPLRYPLLQGEYIIPSPNTAELVCGATHEYSESLVDMDDIPDITAAKNTLEPLITSLYPPLLDHYSLNYATAGIRVMAMRSHVGKVPYLGRNKDPRNMWLIGAMGARGLIHHAYMARSLVEAMSTDGDLTRFGDSDGETAVEG